MDWGIWFLQLSGRPVFLLLVLIVGLGILGLSVVFTRLSNRSVFQNAILAIVALALVALVGLGIASMVSRW